MRDILDLIKNFSILNQSVQDLEKHLPVLGMNSEQSHEMPSELSEHFGKGLRFWQYPNQFSRYLKLLSERKLNSYLEIGCRWGGTFIITSEVLKKQVPAVQLHCCDIIPESELLQEYGTYSEFTYYQTDSLNLKKVLQNKSIDLILIDGDHSYEGVSHDFETALTLKPKLIAFHDIVSDACPGVVQFWQEIKKRYSRTHKCVEFTDQYDSVQGTFLGIGVLILK